MITSQSPARSQAIKSTATPISAWPTYLGITALLLHIVVVLGVGSFGTIRANPAN
jgi:hypothetical protein